MSEAESWQCLKGDYRFVSTDDEEEDGGTEQSIDEERVAYLTSPHSPKGTNLLVPAMTTYASPGQYAQLPDMVQDCHGLPTHSSVRSALQTGIFIKCSD